MTATASPPPSVSEDQLDPLSASFLDCLKQQADVVSSDLDALTPMIAQARAILYLDALMRLHEAGLEESIKLNDPSQASAWTRDLSIVELALSLLRNIQPLDAGDGANPGSDAVITTN